MVIFNLKNFASDDFKEKQEVQHSVDRDVAARRQKHIDMINGYEAAAQERRALELGE